MTRDRSVCWLVAVVIAGLGAGCGGEDAGHPDYEIDASAAWSWSADTPSALGYTITVVLEQRTIGPEMPCRKAPASARLTVNGADVPLTIPNSPEGCLEGRFLSPPVLGPLAVTARVEEEGHLVGEVMFEDLMPGTAATLVSPVDGQVHAGDEIVIAPPAVLPTDYAVRPVLYPLDASTWMPSGILTAPAANSRLLDGVHLIAPAFSGPAALIVKGEPAFVGPDVTCPGFARCTESIEVTLGPLMLTGAP